MEECDGTGSPKKAGNDIIEVPPPSALPSFVKFTSPNEAFHQASTFSPVIPESKSRSDSDAKPSVGQSEANDEESGGSLFSWVGNKGSNLFNKVAEKAKMSVGTVITTLDPQMRDFMGGKIVDAFSILVTSEKECVISAIREAAQAIFPRNVNIKGCDMETEDAAKQIVGFASASKIADLHIQRVRSNANEALAHTVVIAVENFITEITTDKWFEMDILALHDSTHNIYLEVISQSIPIPSSVVTLAQEETPPDYQHKNTGLACGIAQLMANNLKVFPTDWQETLTGVSRRNRILQASHVLLNLYKNSLPLDGE